MEISKTQLMDILKFTWAPQALHGIYLKTTYHVQFSLSPSPLPPLKTTWSQMTRMVIMVIVSKEGETKLTDTSVWERNEWDLEVYETMNKKTNRNYFLYFP